MSLLQGRNKRSALRRSSPSPQLRKGCTSRHPLTQPPAVAAFAGAVSVRDFELLNPAAPVGFRHIDAALRVDRDGVAVRKGSDLMSRTPEAGKNLAACVIHDVDLLGAAVHHVEKLLLAVG